MGAIEAREVCGVRGQGDLPPLAGQAAGPLLVCGSGRGLHEDTASVPAAMPALAVNLAAVCLRRPLLHLASLHADLVRHFLGLRRQLQPGHIHTHSVRFDREVESAWDFEGQPPCSGLFGALIKRGWSVNRARKTAMLVCALAVVPIMFASQARSLWVAVALVSLAAAAHQGWSANLFTLTSDMFPRPTIASVVGFGGMFGAIGGMYNAKATGYILDATGSYVPVFMVAGSAYLIALLCIHLLAPKLEPAKIGGSPMLIVVSATEAPSPLSLRVDPGLTSGQPARASRQGRLDRVVSSVRVVRRLALAPHAGDRRDGEIRERLVAQVVGAGQVVEQVAPVHPGRVVVVLAQPVPFGRDDPGGMRAPQRPIQPSPVTPTHPDQQRLDLGVLDRPGSLEGRMQVEEQTEVSRQERGRRGRAPHRGPVGRPDRGLAEPVQPGLQVGVVLEWHHVGARVLLEELLRATQIVERLAPEVDLFVDG